MKLSQKLHTDVVSSLTPCLCPPRLWEVTWMTGGVLTWFLMSYLDGTFTEGSDVLKGTLLLF